MLNSLKMERIVLQVPAGFSLDLAIREAVKVAMEQWCEIEFESNGKQYVVDHTEIFKLVDYQHSR